MKDLCFQSLEALIPFISDRKKMESILLNKGLQEKRAVYFSAMLEEDWAMSSDIPYDNKVWAMKHGFLPSRIKLYGLNKANYQNYLADMDYFLLHPLNNHFAIWINDKLTLKYVIPSVFHTLEGRNLSIMPEYYLYIENDGRYSYLMDSPSYIARDEAYLYNLLKEKKTLALKPSRGAGGHGFVKLQYDGTQIYANSQLLDKPTFDAFKDTLNGYIVTEYVTQHKDLDHVWDSSVCTLRIIAVKIPSGTYDGGTVGVITSYARFGTSKSEGASNLSSGGVGIPYDFETGIFGDYFYRYMKFSENGNIKLACHPDSKVSLKGKLLPNWEVVRDVVYSLCSYLSSLEFFGFDLMVTDDGVKMCEINTHPALDDAQVMCIPIWQNPIAKEYFMNKIKAKFV